MSNENKPILLAHPIYTFLGHRVKHQAIAIYCKILIVIVWSSKKSTLPINNTHHEKHAISCK